MHANHPTKQSKDQPSADLLTYHLVSSLRFIWFVLLSDSAIHVPRFSSDKR